jgi:ketosteroid isomerase-like protein
MAEADFHHGELVVAERLRAALDNGDLDAYGALLHDDVTWGDTVDGCHGRDDVLNRLRRQRAAGLEVVLDNITPGHEALLAVLRVHRPGDAAGEQTVHQVLKLRDERIAEIRAYPTRSEAAARASVPGSGARSLVPILNVSDLASSFEWFDKLGWSKLWDWRDSDAEPPTFGAVGSGESEIFLCRDGQGGRGADGMWLSIWIEDVDALHAQCEREGVEVLHPPRDEPWGMREMHVRHPDGHVFRIGRNVHYDAGG